MRQLAHDLDALSGQEGEEAVTAQGQEQSNLLTPGEVAKLFRVDPKTVTRWAKAGKLPSIKTPGGHKRFKRSIIEKLLEEEDL